MLRLLPALDLDLRIAHGGHRFELKGSRLCFVARFATLRSLLHFLRLGWSLRRQLPREVSLSVEWHNFRLSVQ